VAHARGARHRVGMDNSPDYDAALLLLTTPVLGRRTPLAIHPYGFDWDALFGAAADGPPAARTLVGAAYELWEAKRAIALWEIPATLDHAQMDRMIDALCLSHGGRLKRRPAALPRAGETAAVRHVLASPRLERRVGPHLPEDGFDWYALLATAPGMSRGQRLLVEIAHDLWTRGDEVGLRQITRSLDHDGFARVVDALATCREGFARAPQAALAA
jgi:hypothetical protein